MASSEDSPGLGADRIPVLVSVIVPVFNVAHYLTESLASLFSQTLESIEILIVDDGSDDDTLMIAEKAALDPRVVLLRHDINKGPAAARNTGLAAARGEYVAFIDGDDLADPRMMEAMVAAAQASGAEVVTCGFTSFSGDGSDERESAFRFPTGTLLAGAELTRVLQRGHRDKLFWFNPLFLYSRELVLRCGVQFRTDVTLGEDTVFNTEILRAAQSLIAIPERLYRVRRREGSLTSSGSSTWNERIESQAAALVQVYRRVGIWDQVQGDYYSYVLSFQLPQAIANARSLAASRKEFSLLLRTLSEFTWVRDAQTCREAWSELTPKQRMMNWLMMREHFDFISYLYWLSQK